MNGAKKDLKRCVVDAPFVGRQKELTELDRVLNQSIQYETPLTVTLVGNQGVGKTRLLKHWAEHLKARRPEVRFLRASAGAQSTAYSLFKDLLEDRFNLRGAEDPMEAFRQQVEQVFQDRRVAEVLHFLGGFIGLSVRENPFLRAIEDAPLQHEQIARTLLRRFLEMDAQVGPLVLVLEDLHRADDDSLSLFMELADAFEGAPICMIGSCRPDLLLQRPSMNTFEGEHCRVDLPLLERAESEVLIRHLLRRVEDLSQELIDLALEMTAGSPFFMEELVRVLIDNLIIMVDGENWTLDEDRLDELDLPLSVDEAVHARLAVLSPMERDVLEKASTLGSVFWIEALVCFSRLQQEVEEKSHIWMADVLHQTIKELLDALIDKDYLLEMPDSSIPEASEYVFKHNMEREQITKMVNPARMKQYHLFAAQWLETKIPDRSEAQLEFLGQHYEQGGNNRRAAFCFVRAGDKARNRYANEQAANHYRRGVRLLDLDDATSKIETLHNLGDVTSIIGRTTEALEHFSEMLRYAWLLDHKAKGGAAHRRIGKVYTTLGDYEKAIEHLQMGLRLFERAGDRRGSAACLDDVGKVALFKGEYAHALEYHRRALSIKKEIGDPRSIAVALNNIGTVHQKSGSFGRALECFIEALELRKEVGDRVGIVASLRNLGSVHRAKSDYNKAFELWLDALRLTREIGDRIHEGYLLIDLGEAELQRGKLEEAGGHLEEAVILARELGDRRLKAKCARTMCEVKLAAGDLVEAEREGRDALEISEQLGLRPDKGVAWRVLAEVAAAHEIDEKHKAKATELFRQAITQFTELGNDLELARTFSSFADFNDRCGQWQEADQLRSKADEIYKRL